MDSIKEKLKYFQTEREIVEYAYDQVVVDKWARCHCVGFTGDENESMELSEKLDKLGIEFMQDRIPYYVSGNPVYRTFVFGCDSQKATVLKEKYRKMK